MQSFFYKQHLSRRDYAVLLIITLLVFLHFFILRTSPPGFYIDEAATGAQVKSMLAHGTDVHGVPHPLFTESLGGGFTTPLYYYPLTAWAFIFGTSEYALRAFSMAISLLAIFVVGIGMHYWAGKRGTYAAWLIGLTLPWAWISGSLCWDTGMLALWVALAWWAFSRAYHAASPQLKWVILFGMFLIAGAYTYPPFRVTGPLLLVAGLIILYKKHPYPLRHIVVTIMSYCLAALPLAWFLLFQPNAMGRTQALSVFAHGIISGTATFIGNIILLLNPVTLFITGDPNLRHSTGVLGMLGGGAAIGVLVVIYMCIRRQIPAQHKKLMCIAVIAMLLSLIGSALTAEGQPNYLRATAAWPFWIIVATIGWLNLLAQYKKYFRFSISIAFLLACLFITDLAVNYPTRSADYFDVPMRIRLLRGEHVSPAEYQSLGQQYYR